MSYLNLSSLEVEKLEFLFKQNRYDGDLTAHHYFEYREGSIPILISAPHATNHVSKGNFKRSDSYTGSLALLLHKWTNAHVIYLTRQAQRNPNAEETSDYKETIKSVHKRYPLKLLIDLHGAASHRPFDIDFGTSLGESISKGDLAEIQSIFSTHGLSNLTENHTFKAPYPTITNYTGTILNIPSVQLEINKQHRTPSEDFLSYHSLLNALIETINVFHKK